MSWWKTAKVGDKVTRVDDIPWCDAVTNELLKDQEIRSQFGETFEIKAIKASALTKSGVVLFLGHVIGGREVLFEAEAFRPVQTKSTETGMAILRGLLDSAPVDDRMLEQLP